MHYKEFKLRVAVYDNIGELSDEDLLLMHEAKNALQHSYSPYSKFKVAAAILLANGKIVTGTNQENAAFPAGICAEGTALGAVSSLYPQSAIKKIVITVKSEVHKINHPVAPCGVCRQRILEYEQRFNSNIPIMMMGEEGEIYSVNSVKDILPLNFSKADM